MENNSEALKALTQKFISDFINLSGESSATYAINCILPEIMYPLLPQYEEPSNCIYMPMSHFETNMAKEGLKNRLSGWTNDLVAIADKLQSGKDTDFDRYRFENFKSVETEESSFRIIDYKTLETEDCLKTYKVISFDIISTTNFFKGTVVLKYHDIADMCLDLYPVKGVSLICNGKTIFDWSVYKEFEEYTHKSLDIDNTKDLNSFYSYTKSC
tara:strand:+ start:517 stop:1158 length:642 start_codon:yes stop_codon:yes gene_type:complete